MATLYKSNGDTLEVQPQNGTKFELHELQEYVQGHVQPIYIADTHIMLVNEDGLLLGLPPNTIATELLRTIKQKPVFTLLGDILLCRNEEFD